MTVMGQSEASEIAVLEKNASWTCGSTGFLIASKWWNSWVQYSGYTGPGAAPGTMLLQQPGGGGPRPGPLGNASLMLSDASKQDLGKTAEPEDCPLRPGLVEQQDFVVVSEASWKRLHALYGGGPGIARRVVVDAAPGPSGHNGERWSRVDLYPLRIEVVHFAKGSKDPKRAVITIHAEDSLAALKKRACAAVDVHAEDVALWDYTGGKPVRSLESPLLGEMDAEAPEAPAAPAAGDSAAASDAVDADAAAKSDAAAVDAAGATGATNGGGAAAMTSMDVDGGSGAAIAQAADGGNGGDAGGGAGGAAGYMARPLRQVPLLDNHCVLLRSKGDPNSDSDDDACGSDNDTGVPLGRKTAGKKGAGGAGAAAKLSASEAAAAAAIKRAGGPAAASGSASGAAPAPPARTSGSGAGTSGAFGGGSRLGQKPFSAWDDNVMLRDGQLPGLAGLSNLGNTCFMNSSLQCLAHAAPLMTAFLGGAYLQDLNRTNPLGMKGELAEAFGSLMAQLWRGGVSAVTPRSFKAKIGRFAPQFSGYAQHDSQEFLAFLLDGLHEDTNRIKNKPYIEEKDQPGRPDEEVAAEAWANYRVRNNSLVVDHFQGLYKSTLDCPQCGFNSVKFDPFMYLSLPLPESRRRVVEAVLVRTDGSELPLRMALDLAAGAAVGDLLRAVARVAGLPAEVQTAPASHLLAARPLRTSPTGPSDEVVLLADPKARLADAMEAGGAGGSPYSLRSSAASSMEQGLVVYYYPDSSCGPTAEGMAPVIVHFKRPDSRRPTWARGVWCGAPLVLYMPEARPPYDPEQVLKQTLGTAGSKTEFELVGDCPLSAALSRVLRPIQRYPILPAPDQEPPQATQGLSEQQQRQQQQQQQQQQGEQQAGETTMAAADGGVDGVVSASEFAAAGGAASAAAAAGQGMGLLVGGSGGAEHAAEDPSAAAPSAGAPAPMEEDGPPAPAPPPPAPVSPSAGGAAAAGPVIVLPAVVRSDAAVVNEMRPGTPARDDEDGSPAVGPGVGGTPLSRRRRNSSGDLMEGLEPLVDAAAVAAADAGGAGGRAGADASMPGTPLPAPSVAMDEDDVAAAAAALPEVIVLGPAPAPSSAEMVVEGDAGAPTVQPFDMWSAQGPMAPAEGMPAAEGAAAVVASGPPFSIKLCNSKGLSEMWGTMYDKDISKEHNREFLLLFSDACSSTSATTSPASPAGPYAADLLDSPAEHASLQQHRRRAAAGPQPVSLDACMNTFLQPERLAESDAWYCPRCKSHVCADKKLDLWSLPEVLVVHLKRFSYTRYSRNKLDTRVDFPLHGLDLGSHVMRAQGVPPVYDLFAVSNHYGSMGGGHYTAYAKLPSPPPNMTMEAAAVDGAVQDDPCGDRWYCFDDSHVSPVDPESVRSSAAYVLFYRRRAEAAADPPQVGALLERLRQQRAAIDAMLDGPVAADGAAGGSPDSGSDRQPDQDQAAKPYGSTRGGGGGGAGGPVSIAAAAAAAKAARDGGTAVQGPNLAAVSQSPEREAEAGAGGIGGHAGSDLYGDVDADVAAPSSPTPMSVGNMGMGFEDVGDDGGGAGCSTPPRRDDLLPSYHHGGYDTGDYDAFTVDDGAGGAVVGAHGGGGGMGDDLMGPPPPGSPAEADVNNTDLLADLYDDVDAIECARGRHSGSDIATSAGGNDQDDVDEGLVGQFNPFRPGGGGAGQEGSGGEDMAEGGGDVGGGPAGDEDAARLPGHGLSLMSTSPV